MDDFLDLPTLIAIVVAVFVLFRLRSVLGTRTGTERPPVDSSRSTPVEKKAGTEDDTVPVSMSEAFCARGADRGDPVRCVTLPGAGHFEVIDPTSDAWARVAA